MCRRLTDGRLLSKYNLVDRQNNARRSENISSITMWNNYNIHVHSEWGELHRCCSFLWLQAYNDKHTYIDILLLRLIDNYRVYNSVVFVYDPDSLTCNNYNNNCPFVLKRNAIIDSRHLDGSFMFVSPMKNPRTAAMPLCITTRNRCGVMCYAYINRIRSCRKHDSY